MVEGMAGRVDRSQRARADAQLAFERDVARMRHADRGVRVDRRAGRGRELRRGGHVIGVTVRERDGANL